MLRKIIDSNYFANGDLEKYFQLSKSNFGVLTEYSGIEAYKSANPVNGLYETISILEKYPKQVIVLKGVRMISSQQISRAGYLDRMVWRELTRDFSTYCNQVELAKRGSVNHIRAVNSMAKDANNEADKALAAVQDYLYAAEHLIEKFTLAEIKEIKSTDNFSDEIFKKIVSHLMDMTLYSFKDFGRDVRKEKFNDIAHSVIFRNLLCHYLHTIKTYTSGTLPTNHEKIRNSIYDCGFASYATFFDGLLSNDRRAIQTYENAKRFLRRLENSN